MIDQLPVLQVLLPLLAAPLCVLLRRRVPVTALALAACWGSFAVAIGLLQRVLAEGVVVYEMGAWSAPWGIEYRVDLLSAFVLLFVSGIGALVLTYAPKSLTAEIPADRLHFFYTLYLLCLTGLLGITITGDLFNLFVFLEVSSLSSYGLISLGRNRQALTAAFRYLIMGTIGATFILIGVGLMYQMTGTLNMADMVQRIADREALRTVRVAFAFLTVGIGLKMALFPLHQWLPDAYAHAPSTVSAFIAATSTKVSVYILLRFVFTIYGVEFAFANLHIERFLIPLSLAAMFLASAAAIYQTDLKRLLAYSSVAQVGYMTLGASFASVEGLTASIAHLFNHALTKGGMFLAVGCLVYRIGRTSLANLEGIGRRMPWTTFAWVLGGLGLIGVPGTAGFVSKWYLLEAALGAGAWPLALAILLSSLLAVIYIWKVIEVAYFRLPQTRTSQAVEAPAVLLLPTWLLIGASLYFGFRATFSADLARQAAEALLQGMP
ncbi:MAG: monovalent cation/H+ antiporter subunit D family protein [Acidobacteriota bacterium]